MLRRHGLATPRGVLLAAGAPAPAEVGAWAGHVLKAQVLATSLDVYFSDPALGGNKITAPAPIGGVSFDLTQVCKMIDGTGGTFRYNGAADGASLGSGFTNPSDLIGTRGLGAFTVESFTGDIAEILVYNPRSLLARTVPVWPAGRRLALDAASGERRTTNRETLQS